MNRKLRKLLRAPHRYFFDAGVNFLRRNFATRIRASGPRRACRFRYSIVVVLSDDSDARQLTGLAGLLAEQNVDVDRCLQLIVVDARGKGVVTWAPPRASASICQVLRDPLAGVACARNRALTQADGEWVAFLEAGDIPAKNWVRHVDTFLAHASAAKVGLLCCDVAYRDISTGKIQETHVRREHFASKKKTFTLDKLPSFFEASTAGLFFRSSILRLHASRFVSTGVQTFEELAFVNGYLLEMGSAQVGLLRAARLFINSTRQQRERTEVLGAGAKALAESTQLLLGLKQASSCAGATLRRCIDNAVLHALVLPLDICLSQGPTRELLEGGCQASVDELYATVLAEVPEKTIEAFKRTPIRNRIALLHRYKAADPKLQTLYVDDYDSPNGWIRARYFTSHVEPLEVFHWGKSRDVLPRVVKSRTLEFLGAPIVYERIVWLPTFGHSGGLAAVLNRVRAGIFVDGKRRETPQPWQVVEELTARPAARRNQPLAVRRIRRLAAQPDTVARFRDAWLFMDRDVEADDNAEHLYRYARQAHPEINAFFVLDSKSPSWDRLKAEGFRLIPFGSTDHKLALLHCAHLLSSHAAPFVVSLMPKTWYGDLLTYRFTFLQHGVTKDDISKWINSRSIDCFVTTSKVEYESIAGSANRYKLTPREVVLTGFPRHDALLRGAKKPERLIMIMPTWRLFLAGALKGKCSTRTVNPGFYESQYASLWKGILHSERLAQMMREYGYKAVLFPHPNIEPYLDWFDVPSHIEVVHGERRGSIQSLFQRAALMLTDYSSVAFEMAYLQKAVLYYQFDSAQVFGGEHSYQKGYYEYRRDGFGPVVEDEAMLLDELERLLQRDSMPEPQYLSRMQSAFAHIDTDNCKRTMEAVMRMDGPSNERGAMAGVAVTSARGATASGAWELAAQRWERVRALADEEVLLRRDSGVMQAHALRMLGRLDEAQALLDEIAGDDPGDQACRIELAEMAMATGQWERARGLWDALMMEAELEPSQCERFSTLAEECRMRGGRAEDVDPDSRISADPRYDGDPESVDAADSDWQRLASGIEGWGGLLSTPHIDAGFRVSAQKELARLRILAGRYDEAERDIAALRTGGTPTPSDLLLALELALARGHAGEASATMNVMMQMPLSSLSDTERARFAGCMNCLVATS